MVDALNEETSLVFGRVDEIRSTLNITDWKDGPLTVLGFRGTDSLSGLSSYLVRVASSAETAVKLDEAIGHEAVLVVERADDETSRHVMRGTVQEVFAGGVTVGKGQRQSTILIMPRLAELRHTKSCRVFQDATVVEIAKDLLKLWKIELVERLHPEPLKREYCTQVNESDFAFLARILSEEGIHFHLEHTAEKSVVVLVNDPRGYDPVAGRSVLPFREAGGAVTVDHVKSIRRERRVRPGSVAYRDYNFLKPEEEMTARLETATPNEPGTLTAREVYEYPGHYNHPDDESVGVGQAVQYPTRSGVALSGLRLEEQRSDALTFSGTSTSLRLRVGHWFEVQDHPDKPFNRKYVVTHVTVSGAKSDVPILGRGDQMTSSGASITVDFVAVPAEVPTRPRLLPKPAAHLRTARVVGPKESEPYVDEFGRIKVQFAWDRDGQRDDKSSCWVRMATPIAHHNQGSYTAHRVGAEVLVDFLDGDVDRPVVTAALFHAENRQPQKLPDDATRAVIYRGLSVPGNAGKNEISCEDRAGNEEIFLHAQRDLVERIRRNHTETISANQTSSVGANQTTSVGANQTISVGANRTVNVTGDENIHIVNSRHENVDDGESVTVKGGRMHTVATKDDRLTVESGSRSVKVCNDDLLTAKAKKDRITTVYDIQGDEKVRVAHKEDAALVLTAGDAVLETTNTLLIKTPSGSITIAGGKIAIDAAEELLLTCGKSKLSLKSDGTMTGMGSKEVGFKCSNSQLKLDPAKAALSGAGVDVTAVGQAVIGGALIKIG
jgi:type VI secretion system secreted protein VgrG